MKPQLAQASSHFAFVFYHHINTSLKPTDERKLLNLYQAKCLSYFLIKQLSVLVSKFSSMSHNKYMLQNNCRVYLFSQRFTSNEPCFKTRSKRLSYNGSNIKCVEKNRFKITAWKTTLRFQDISMINYYLI